MAHFAIEAAHAESDEMRELAAGRRREPPIRAPGSAPRSNEAIIVGSFGARSRITQGSEVTAVVDTRALHFFDPATGAGIYDGTPSTKGDTP